MTEFEERLASELRSRIDVMEAPHPPLAVVHYLSDRPRRGATALVWAAVAVVALATTLGVHLVRSRSVPADRPHVVRAGAWHLLGQSDLSPRESPLVANFGARVVILGGANHPTCQPVGASCPILGYRQDGATYDVALHTWTPIAHPPRAIQTARWAQAGNTLFVVGEYNPLRILAYNVTSNTWRVLAPPPSAFDLSNDDIMAASAGKVYVTSRQQSSNSSGRVSVMNLHSGVWSQLPAPPTRPALGLRSVFPTPNGILIAGSHASGSGALYDQAYVEVLRNGRWRTFAAPQFEGTGESFAWTGSALVAPFPEHGGSGVQFYPQTSSWVRLPAQPGSSAGGWWGESSASAGRLILRNGVVFDAGSRRSVVLTRPVQASQDAAGTLSSQEVYAFDTNGRLWGQRLGGK